ncbi:D-mannonate dehydratase ManD [Dyella nitratireducens]|uniref:Bifunctional D-altronate/D-mannonate dehydratase n=1 Tax=Dyella nitratireducens TaxID=1849580 RepID=A0ABQ1FRP0_9GAMM|nr:D-mannonate dehydratase ManD [Dyella nitratireducens]GGA26665.1 bifunctional D-altronate/D-mannonate dehydratase [Dyella nitratireducens]GLQ43521.1 bifunctional D-altronate/D-mannonate dehydratase [Dyella nitratireducens]
MNASSSSETTSHGSHRDREIVDARVIVTCPGRNFVTLKIETRSGITGLGDATLNGRELAVASYLQDHVVPNLIGRDAGRIEDIWQFLYRGAYWRRGPVTMTAIAAVDVALWDILGKLAGMPIYQLLGGRSREGALVYGHANGRDVAEASDAVGRFIEQGFLAVRAQCGVPGVKKAYGISSGKAYEPAESELPLETVWSTPQYLDIVPQLFERLRADHGNDVHLLHDVHHRLTPIEAARLARSVEPYRLFWLEDATPAENQKSFELIRQHSTTPLAVGEVFNSIWDCKHLIENQLIDYIRTTIVHGGGITHLRRMADFAALHQVRTGFHGATDLSPVCMGAALHFDTWVPNFGIQEYMFHADETNEVFPHDYAFHDGRLHCGEAPGHGVSIDEKLAARFPYSPKQLPVARLEDGTMWDW